MPDALPRLGSSALSAAAAEVRARRRPGVVHLGLGAFHRSHQAWYTQHAGDDDPWGVVAFTGRGPAAADALTGQDGLYTLVTRSADGDSAELVDVVVAAHDGGPEGDEGRWLEAVADPRTAVVTLTVTEAAYEGGHVPDRLVAGLRARRDAGAGPVAVLSCDNLPRNGEVVRDAVRRAADGDEALLAWIEATVSFPSAMVDRITPATTDDDRAAVASLTGRDDRSPVVAEPFAEWVVCGDFPAGRPAWERAGARFVDDLEPYEQRKLWLLNAGHSLLAYLGLLLGHETVDEAVGDPRCTGPLERLWDEAAAVLPLPADEVEEARASLVDRFRNPRIRHRLRQIASDGSVKLPVRVVDPLRRRRDAELPVGDGAATALAAWWLHLTMQADLVSDALATALGPSPDLDDVLDLVAPDLAHDAHVRQAVEEAADRIRRLVDSTSPTPRTAAAPAAAVIPSKETE